ncbi:MAG TPA: YbdD/YjiX family protein [Burkholderiales bacterium]|nr:YbdD/YjiX family protein [Burkholderiales bacterium]
MSDPLPDASTDATIHFLSADPNYDAYLAHMRATHPGATPLERGEFLAWALERRHRGRGPRCC